LRGHDYALGGHGLGGTSLSAEQTAMIRHQSVSDTVILALDGNASGRVAAVRELDALTAASGTSWWQTFRPSLDSSSAMVREACNGRWNRNCRRSRRHCGAKFVGG
jgi:hypothetical protein